MYVQQNQGFGNNLVHMPWENLWKLAVTFLASVEM
jgi:hypothetical protein